MQFFNLFKLSFQVRDDRRKQSDVSEEGGTSSESPPRDIISDQVNYFAKIAHFLEIFEFFFSSSGIPQNNSDQNVLSSTPDPDWFAYAANDISLFPHADRHDL